MRWLRDFEAAVELSRSERKPLLLLFQEVPGCATCVGFGESVLSHALLVDAIETEFVPVAVLNNRPGRDAALLRRFGESAWNNPVVRFVDSDGRDLIPRADGVWTPHGIAERMIGALRAAGRPVPAYLALAAEETSARFPATATFGTHCFWEGEACIGTLPGIVATEAAWLGGQEVVQVRFDARRLSYRQLLDAVHSGGCAASVWSLDDAQHALALDVFGAKATRRADGAARSAPASDQKRHLRSSPLRTASLTPLQQVRVNAAVANGSDPLRWLSPRQRGELGSP